MRILRLTAQDDKVLTAQDDKVLTAQDDKVRDGSGWHGLRSGWPSGGTTAIRIWLLPGHRLGM